MNGMGKWRDVAVVLYLGCCCFGASVLPIAGAGAQVVWGRVAQLCFHSLFKVLSVGLGGPDKEGVAAKSVVRRSPSNNLTSQIIPLQVFTVERCV